MKLTHCYYWLYLHFEDGSADKNNKAVGPIASFWAKKQQQQFLTQISFLDSLGQLFRHYTIHTVWHKIHHIQFHSQFNTYHFPLKGHVLTQKQLSSVPLNVWLSTESLSVTKPRLSSLVVSEIHPKMRKEEKMKERERKRDQQNIRKWCEGFSLYITQNT